MTGNNNNLKKSITLVEEYVVNSFSDDYSYDDNIERAKVYLKKNIEYLHELNKSFIQILEGYFGRRKNNNFHLNLPFKEESLMIDKIFKLQAIFNDSIVELLFELNSEPGMMSDFIDDEDEDEDSDEYIVFIPAFMDIDELVQATLNKSLGYRKRVIAAVALNRSESDKAFGALVEALESSEKSDIRSAFLLELGRNKDKRVIDYLLSFYEQEQDEDVKYMALVAIRNFRSNNVMNWLISKVITEENKSIKRLLYSHLSCYSFALITPMMQLLKDGVKHSSDINYTLQLITTPEVGNQLLYYLKECSDEVKVCITKYLRYFNTPEVLSALKNLLNDPDEKVRHYADISYGVLTSK